jgi:hypothetical protein
VSRLVCIPAHGRPRRGSGPRGPEAGDTVATSALNGIPVGLYEIGVAGHQFLNRVKGELAVLVGAHDDLWEELQMPTTLAVYKPTSSAQKRTCTSLRNSDLIIRRLMEKQPQGIHKATRDTS